jgi:hypothetical protein
VAYLWLPNSLTALFYNAKARRDAAYLCAVVEMEGYSVREANVFPTLTVAVGGFVATLAGDCRCGGHQRCHRTRPWRWACYVGMGLAVAAGLLLMP